MWKNIGGRLVHMTDPERVKFRTNVSKSILNELCALAEKYNTYPNYLLETGLEKVLSEGSIVFKKENRPKDRIQYKTTYDKALLDSVKEFAKQHKLFVNDVIEYSVSFIDVKIAKNKDYKNRIEKE